MGATGEVVVFTDTNIDTHIAMAVSPDITAADFKREAERVHFSFFPKLGEIRAFQLLVKRKSCFYHLTESLPIKYAFQGLKGTWFLHVQVKPSHYLNKLSLSPHPVENDGKVSNGSYVIDAFIENSKKKIACNVSKMSVKGVLGIEPLVEELSKSASNFDGNEAKKSFLENKVDNIQKSHNVNEKIADESIVCQISRNKKPVVVESPEGRTMEAISIESINDISGHSSDFNFSSRCHDSKSSSIASIALDNQLHKQLKGQKEASYSNKQVYSIQEFAAKTTPPSQGSSGNKLETTAGVGRRLVVAANNLRVSGKKQKPVISFYRFRGSPNVQSVSRISVFEISDSDD